MRKFLLFAALVVASIGLGASVAQAAPPNLSVAVAMPTYEGGDGSGAWTQHVTLRVTGAVSGTVMRVWTKGYLWADGTSVANVNGGYDLDGSAYYAVGSNTWSLNYNSYIAANGAYFGGWYGCPYHGFHWFGSYVTLSRQFWVPGQGWGLQSAFYNTAVSAGQYSQVCL